MTSKMHVFTLGLAMLALVACGGDEKKPASGGGNAKPAEQKGAEPAPAAGAAYDKAKGTGTLKVTVKWAGAAQTQAFYKMGSSDVCASHDGKVVKEATEVNADGTVPHCFVSASKGPHEGLSGFDKSAKPSMTQKDCVYVPHVMGVMVGQSFSVSNSDSTTHNVHPKPTKNKDKYNLSQPQGKSDDMVFEKAEDALPFVCDVHGWMNAYVFVMKHPFHGTTDRATGTTTISGLYPGKYTFKVWHSNFAKTGSEKTVEVEVKDGANEVTVELGK